MSIPSTSTARPVAVWMLFLAIVLLGVVSFVRLPIDLLPDVSYPRLVIYSSYPEVAPAEVERQVTQRIEAAAAGVPGVERLTSVSREGVSLVTLRFSWGTDMDFAMLAVRERLDNVRDQLPESVDRPTILRVDPESDPIMTLSVAGGGDLQRTKELAETVFRRRLEQLDGVAQAAVTGGLDREIQVEVNPVLLLSYGLTIEDVSQALDRANVTAPGGTILQGRYRYPLRTLGEFQTVEEIRQVIVARQPVGGGGGGGASGAGPSAGAQGGRAGMAVEAAGAGGSGGNGAFRVVRLADIATVIDGFAERESLALYDGQEAVGILVFKESGANTVAVAERVDEVLGQLSEEYPEIQVDVANSQAGFIADSISNVVQALIYGGILAFLVLFLFLRDPRYPVAIALAIPISVVGTFALMDAAGVSLNIMSLGGLALGVGMLVDNSIVVLENIFRHREEEGLGAAAAAARGAEEVQGAITASTLTTISVFGPIIYVEGVAGELFKDLSLAVAFSLLMSLVVALTLLPSLAARFAGGPTPRVDASESDVAHAPVGRIARMKATLGRAAGAPFRLARELVGFWATSVLGAMNRVLRPVATWFDGVFERFADWYHGILEIALDRPGRVVVGSLATLAAALLLGATLQRDLLPEVDQGAFEVHLALEEGAALDATEDAAGVIEAAALADPDIEAVFGNIGRDVRAYAEGEDASGLNTATFQIRIRPDASSRAPAARLRSLSSRFPPGALSVETGQATALGTMLGSAEADVAVRVRSEDLDLAYAMAQEVEQRLLGLGGLGNVRIGTERGQPELQIEIDRVACATYGIDAGLVARTVENAMRGAIATDFVEFDRKISVVVRYPSDLRYSRETLEGLRVQGVPIRELVRLTEAVGPAEVRREDQARVIPVYADVVSGGLDQAIQEIETALSDIPPSRDVRTEVGGENEEMRRSFRDLAFAFGLALVLVYMILAAQFESFVHPFTILMAVPLALVGAVGALWVTGQGLNTMSLIGAVILVGIVVNDAIVKVDFINQARARGAELREAILEAGRVRLRPIVMTTVTTVLGLFPMALGIGRGSDLRAPLAIAVIGGLTVATALTLVVVPVVYQMVERARVAIFGGAAAS
ncbi:MAG: efflux RND transporter permease subunit [Gemmatimonadota bacterium]